MYLLLDSGIEYRGILLCLRARTLTTGTGYPRIHPSCRDIWRLGKKSMSIMYQLQNYMDIIRGLNITEEEIDIYFRQLYGNFTDYRSDCIETIHLTCYCNDAIRDLATQYKNYHGYASLLVCSFGTLTNMLNIVVLTRKDTKAASINRILTGLAVTDALVMLEYIPFAIYKYFVLPESRIFPYGWAVFVLFHMHFTQLFHTISIALTLTLAVWRYIAIRWVSWFWILFECRKIRKSLFYVCFSRIYALDFRVTIILGAPIDVARSLFCAVFSLRFSPALLVISYLEWVNINWNILFKFSHLRLQ